MVFQLMVGPLGVVATFDETSRFDDDVMFFFLKFV